MAKLPNDYASRPEFGMNDVGLMTAKLWDIEIVHEGPAFRLERQLTIPHVIVVLLKGSAALERDGSTCPLRPDAAYLCPQESTFGIIGTGEEDCSLAIVRFGLFQEAGRSRKRLDAVRARDWARDWLPHEYGDGMMLVPRGRLSGMCRLMHECIVSPDSLQRWRAQLVFQEMLFELLSVVKQEPRMDTLQALEHSKQYLEEHCGEELTIDRLASIAGVSAKYYVELFKKTYGVSALDHLTDVRIRKAKRLMLLSDARLLKDIAHEVGYKDEFYFSRKFRHETGQSPSVFLRKRRRKVAAYGSGSLIGYLLPLQVVPYAAPLHPKWCGYYCERFGADIPVHLDAYRQNERKKANLDLLAESRPDLIVCPPGLMAWERERLAETAPIYEMPEDGVGWRNKLRGLADLLEERDEAERWLAEYNRKARAVSERMNRPEGQRIVLPLRLLKNRFYAHYSLGIADLLYDTLGLLAPHPTCRMPFDLPLEPEQWDALGADRILLLVCQETETLEGWRELQQSPQWLSLGAVRNNAISLVRSDPWREYSPNALDRMLDEAGRLFGDR